MTTARNEKPKPIKRKAQSPREGESKEKKAKLTHESGNELVSQEVDLEKKSTLLDKKYDDLIKKAEDDIQNCNHKLNEIMISCSKSLSEAKPDIDNLIAKFHKEWKENLDKRIACYESVKQKIDKNHDLLENGFIKDRLNNLLAMREAYLGIKEIISNNLIEAENHFKKAIEFKCGFILPKLWLAITCYRLKKYTEAIAICDDVISRFDPEILDKTSAIYTLFPSMKEKIEGYNLNFTHLYFCYSEFFYYRALSIEKQQEEGWEEECKIDISKAYLLRGNNCFYNQSFQNAVLSYEEVLKVNPFFAHVYYRLGILYYTLGEVDKSLSSFEKCLNLTKNSKEKACYLSTLIELNEKVGKNNNIRFLAIEIAKTDCSPPIKIKSLSYNIKMICLSPSTTSLQEIMNLFDELVKSYLGSSEADKEEAFSYFSQSINSLLEFSHDLFRKNKSIDGINVSYEKFLKVYDAIILNLHKDAKKYSGKKSFPNWIYDRLYIRYLSLFTTHYFRFKSWFLNLDEKSKALVPENIKKIQSELDKKKEFIKSVAQGKGEIDINERSGCSLGDLLTCLSLMDCLESNESASSGKEEKKDHDDFKSIFQEYDTLIKEQEPTLARYGKKAQEDIKHLEQYPVKRCESRDRELLFGNEFIFSQYHGYLQLRLVRLILVSNNSFLDKNDKACNSINQFRKYYTDLQTLIDEYKIIAKNNNHKINKSQQEAYITFFEKNLCLIAVDTYLNWLENNKLGLDMQPIFLIKSCEDLLAIIEKLNQQSDHTYILSRFFNESLKENQNYCIIHKRVYKLDKEILRQRFLNLHKQLASDPLSILYGEENNTDTPPQLIPFPYQMLQTRHEEVRKKDNIRSDANVSIHGITIIFSNKESKEARSSGELVMFMPLTAVTEAKNEKSTATIHHLTFDKIEYKRENSLVEKSIFKRVVAGWDFLNKKSPTSQYSFFNKNHRPKQEFNPPAHRHSEQHYFEYLQKIEISKFISELSQLDTRFNNKSTIHVMIHEMVSDRISLRINMIVNGQ